MTKTLELLVNFLQIGFFSIGGGYATIPLIQEQIVNKRGWLTIREFTDIITISQMTPGPLAVNTSTFVGMRIAGLAGAVAATFGCIISGVSISILLYKFFNRYRQADAILNVLQGLKAASTGLIAASAVTLLVTALYGGVSQIGIKQLNITAVILFVLSFITLRRIRVNPIVIIGVTGLAGYFLYG